MENVLKCGFKSCGAEGAHWTPTLLLFAPMEAYQDRVPVAAPAQLGLIVCDDCKGKIEVTDLLCDEGFEQICAGFIQSGFAAPDRSLTQLEWVEWHGSGLQQMEAANKSARVN